MNFSFQFLSQLQDLVVIVFILLFWGFWGYRWKKKMSLKRTILYSIGILVLFNVLFSMLHYNAAKEDKVIYQQNQTNEKNMQEDLEPKKTIEPFNYQKEIETFDASVTKEQKEIHNNIHNGI